MVSDFDSTRVICGHYFYFFYEVVGRWLASSAVLCDHCDVAQLTSNFSFQIKETEQILPILQSPTALTEKITVMAAFSFQP